MSIGLKSDPTLQILIAEDSATQAQHLQHVLTQHGYHVTATANGRLALEAAQRNKPALIISDVVMPEMDGYELCTRVKTDVRLSDVPVILVTTLSDPHDVIRGLECRADNFILKPYDAGQLLHRIQFVLINSQMRQTEQPGMGLEIVFSGQRHSITADRLQILNLLLSTYEAAIQRNKELSSTRDTLRRTNQDLEELTHELEDRVLLRTRELENSNEALRQAQQALIQQERLRALGQMASGIAHDINNAISPIALYTDSLLERETNLSAEARDRLLTIQRAIDDVAQTVARMREFYRPREPEVELTAVELNPLVQQVIDLTRARWSDQPQRRGIMIELNAALAADLPDILGAENEIRDALTNLIFNAVDAMPEGGVIKVRTCLSSNPAAGANPAQHLLLEVADTGTGMDEETRRRCLEPFFTTKGERGTGLGLGMVYGMAQRHGAALQIDSTPGAGTTMRLLFPVVSTASSASVTARVRALRAPARSLRILIVDDNPVLTESLRMTLEQEGHRATAAGGGQAGIDAFRGAAQTGEAFDVVITDLGMPFVDGRQVAESVRATSPHTPIILLTGWGPGQLPPSDNEPVPQVDRVLGKPPRMSELRTALAELTATDHRKSG
ncbi:MAG TPA: response regulator [Steroidobacteraceae bacterium]|jgi:signal transduction histidine kinase|nr:response regulator [Steroidobacteraceae bacterium]